MFIALKDQRTNEGPKGTLRKKGEEMPEASAWDLESVRNLVNAGAMEWRGDGGRFGPHTASVKALDAMKAAVPAKAADEDDAMSRAEINAFMASVQASMRDVLTRLDAFEIELRSTKSKGAASGSK